MRTKIFALLSAGSAPWSKYGARPFVKGAPLAKLSITGLQFVDQWLLRRLERFELLAQLLQRGCRSNQTIFCHSNPLPAILPGVLSQPLIRLRPISVLADGR